MAKDQKITGLSRDFILHPGETLAEVLDDRGMSQKELAIRTGMTEKHVSTIVNGMKSISVAFAKKLEYAFGIESAFWINLQSNYDREMLEFEELNTISKEEVSVLKNLKEVIQYWSNLGWMKTEDNPVSKVLDVRRIMGISDLTDIPNLAYNAAFRAQVKNNKVNTYVLFAWQRMCEMLTQNISIADEINIEKLKNKIPKIKKIMFKNAGMIQPELEKEFAECGIAFKIVENFKGAPVQGFIKKTNDEALVLCMTIRASFADIFWFTLFHEIAHIINEDTKNTFVDFESVSSETESKADDFAKNALIPLAKFNEFAIEKNYSLGAIKILASECGVCPFIVIGRLMKEGLIEWNAYTEHRTRYKWQI